jgi:preprotein translocase subunit SecG
MFGGGGGGNLQGSAVVEKNLDRLTVITALLFGLTNCLLVVLI